MDMKQDISQIRRIYTALSLHYVDGLTQAQIAERTGQSHSTVNRLIKLGHEMGMVEIIVRSPFQDHLALERELAEISGLREVVIEATTSDNAEAVLARVGLAAADLLISKVRPGQSVCISGGKGVTACAAGLRNAHHVPELTVVPATGLVQGRHYTDVNHVAATMARAFDGRSIQMLSPMFAETEAQHAMICEMRTVSRVLEQARSADIAVVGIGGLRQKATSYFDLHRDVPEEEETLFASGAVAELLAQVLNRDGEVTDFPRNRLVVAMSPQDLANVPTSIGVAAGREKSEAICAVVRGGYINTLVTDEITAREVLKRLRGEE
ncbi:sugar-binding transcriptional regulator [Tropicimonas marinistellae]|uniref:sugar-binding transcriptional regulator n=1 Tax=Tropicimonas marinistellae TaxID=1739787 RepID=UPI00082AAF3D|nr:sugar-binding domain-containing protein [Tropicimonas marinistellae]